MDHLGPGAAQSLLVRNLGCPAEKNQSNGHLAFAAGPTLGAPILV